MSPSILESRPPAPDLVDLFLKYGTDKIVNGYEPIYTAIFHGLRNEIRSLLEVGIGTMIPNAHSSMVLFAKEGYSPGGSLRAWRDYLPNARITGIDVQPDTQIAEERIETLICNSTDESETSQKLGDRTFDVIIDDGSHLVIDQLRTLPNLYRRTNPGGFYVIEDISPDNWIVSEPRLVEEIVGHNRFFFAGLARNICVILRF